MQLTIGKRVIRLEQDAPLAFCGARGVVVECVEGTVWLTVDGQAGDFFLRRGEKLRVDSERLALIDGLPRGAVRFHRPASCPFAGLGGRIAGFARAMRGGLRSSGWSASSR
jgi:hypothetical protein